MVKRKLLNDSIQVLIEGAIYDKNFHLIETSQRLGSGVFLNDPPLLRCSSQKIKVINDREFFYLGNYFQQYGHFLLETLPMLSYLFEDRTSHAFFNELPFGKVTQKMGFSRTSDHYEIWARTKTNIDLMKASCKILGINLSRIHINKSAHMRYSQAGIFIDAAEETCIKADFKVVPRPIYMEEKLLDKYPYTVVVDQLLSSCESSEFNFMSNKLFIINEPKFFDISIRDEVVAFFSKKGFDVVNPLDYSLEQQVQIFSKARVIAGFSGSSLHNSIFSKSLDLIIEIGREGMSESNPNQQICADISAADLLFCRYGSSEQIKSELTGLIGGI